MKALDMKVQMMDAGMTLFESGQGFGNTLGQVKAEMEEYGKVLKANDMEDVQVPESTGGYDLFMDWSTAWRVRYISCRLESAGEMPDGTPRYAVSFKEGNRSTFLRGAVMTALLLAAAYAVFLVPGIACTLAGLLLAAVTAYVWLSPSTTAQKTVSALMGKLSAGC